MNNPLLTDSDSVDTDIVLNQSSAVVKNCVKTIKTTQNKHYSAKDFPLNNNQASIINLHDV